jgi:hypothetical protein
VIFVEVEVKTSQGVSSTSTIFCVESIENPVPVISRTSPLIPPEFFEI